MTHYRAKQEDGQAYVEVDLTGSDLLHNPLLNRGTAFTEAERREFSLMGLLPPHVSTMDEQLDRVYKNYQGKPDNIERYVFLRALQDRNETLFYALVGAHLEEMVPIIYTPTVGEAVQKGSHIYRHSRGLYISPDNVDYIDKMSKELPSQEIDVIVVTDNQGILGIGDQGIGGMGIPIGKLSLYTLGAGIPPHGCLPICLDVGTDNEALLDDPLYLGHKQKRITGVEYDNFIDKFVSMIKKTFPNALLQWEDFSKQNAFSNLDRYRGNMLSFNDDIQGTGAVVLAGVVGAMRIKEEKLEDQKFLVFGAGAGGIGVARQIKSALIGSGLSEKEAGSKIFVVDSRGLLLADREGMESYKADLAVDRDMVSGFDVADPARITLLETIQNAKITVLLGFSGQPGTFTEDVVRAMMANSREPVIFPLSNPTSKAEATPAEIYEWTGGGAIVATGSPFDDVSVGEHHFRIGQGNNAFIFPGVGLGVLMARSQVITDEMFTAAAYRLSEFIPSDARTSHCVYPQISDLFKVSVQVAYAVFNEAVKSGVAGTGAGNDPREAIDGKVWKPVYIPYHKS